MVAFAAGSVHSVVVTSDGRAWTFGSNLKGQLGVRDSFGIWGAVTSRPVEIPPWRIGGQPGALSRQELEVQLAQRTAELEQKRVAQISLEAQLDQLMRWGASMSSAAAQKLKGAVSSATVAASALEQIIMEVTIMIGRGGNIVAAAAGGKHTLLLTSNGSVYGFGSNYYGQLASILFDSTYEPYRIGGDGMLLAGVRVMKVG